MYCEVNVTLSNWLANFSAHWLGKAVEHKAKPKLIIETSTFVCEDLIIQSADNPNIDFAQLCSEWGDRS